MSICQGGSGIPFLAQPVYTYLCTGKCTGISVGHADIPDPVLQFVMQKVHAVPSVCVCTGTDRVPPLQFDKQPTVTFLHASSAKFATASTCDLQLRLPTSYGADFDAFKGAMVMALKDNDGFGVCNEQ